MRLWTDGDILSPAMSSNGKRRPRRPSIEMIAPVASPEQAAAIAAALERFLHDTAPAAVPPLEAISPWSRAAVAEAVGREPPTPWGDAESWGAA
jgi:hypothetical protein